jgi:vancomycin resistance protein YoaR
MAEKQKHPGAYRPKRLKKKKNPIGLLLVLFVLVLALGASVFALYQMRSGTMLDGVLKMGDVTMAGIPMKGLTKADAKARLRESADLYQNNVLVITVLDTTLELTPQELGIHPDSDRAVDDAYRGRHTGEFDLIPYLGLSLGTVQSRIEALGDRYNTQFSQTVSAFTGLKPDLTAAPTEGESGMSLSVTVGNPEYGLDTQALYRQVLDAYNRCQFAVTGECSLREPQMPDLDTLYAQTCTEAVDAVMDPTTFEITPERYGYRFDLEAAKAALADARYGESFLFPFYRVTPAVTAQQLAATLFCDVLGSAKTPYKGSDSNNRNTNLGLACDAINGLVLLPGESFSYNQALGKRTAAAGYKPAPTYVDGLTVDTLGGGICQVSSTLYYSTLFADLEIVERYNHGYISDYIDPGMDATVTWGGADFRFSNNTNYPIRIEASRADGYVTVRILGTDEKDYYVKMSYKILSTTDYDTVYREMEKDNKDGYKDGDVIVTPYKGYKVKTYKSKYRKDNDELISADLETTNTYKKRDKVVCKIISPTEATE